MRLGPPGEDHEVGVGERVETERRVEGEGVTRAQRPRLTGDQPEVEPGHTLLGAVDAEHLAGDGHLEHRHRREGEHGDGLQRLRSTGAGHGRNLAKMGSPATRSTALSVPTMVGMDRDQLIERYEAGPAEVRAALDGITPSELDRRPAPGAWTAREIAHHLADSETNSYVRLRRLLAEDDVLIVAYDEEEWARRLAYDRPIEPSLAVLEAVRAASAQLLRTLDDARLRPHGQALRERRLQRRHLARHLRRPRPCPRRPDPPSTPREVLMLAPHCPVHGHRVLLGDDDITSIAQRRRRRTGRLAVLLRPPRPLAVPAAQRYRRRPCGSSTRLTTSSTLLLWR